MRDIGQRLVWSHSLVDLGTGLALAVLLGIAAVSSGAGVPGAWIVPALAGVWIVATGRARLNPLFLPLLLLVVALPLALIASGPLDFLWILLGTLLTTALLAGEAMGPRLTTWLGRLVVCGAGARLLLGWTFSLPETPGSRFALAVAICLLAGSFIASGPKGLTLLLLFFLGGSAVLDRLDWVLVGCGIAVSTMVGRRPWHGLPLLLAAAALAFRAPSHGLLSIPVNTDELLRAGPTLLLACFWFGCEALAALRRGWKEEPSGIILGSAGVVGLVAMALWVTDRAADPSSLYLAAFAVSLGLAGRRRDVGVWEAMPTTGKPPRKAALVASVAMGGAALGGTAALSQTGVGVAAAALALLVVLGVLHFFRTGWNRIFLAPVVFTGLALLATRPFAVQIAPGSADWWRSPPALAALFSLAAAMAGAGHAIRRPGRIGAAQVAGAVASLWLLGLLAMEDAGIAVGEEELTVHVSIGVFSVFMLFIGWAGPLGFGEAEVEGTAKRLMGLPLAATVIGLAALVIAGFS